jgi:hypothetical protein
LSFDESYGWSEEQLSTGCMAIPWLLPIGFITTYSALFGKLWRINEVLRMTRRKIDFKQFLWPFVVLVVVALVILSLWTGIDPLYWDRKEIDATTGESEAFCRSRHLFAFAAPLVAVMLIPAVLTGLMAHRTKDVDAVYSESRWIFIMILVQCEVVLFSLPMFALLEDMPRDARYMVSVSICWTFPMSTLGLIFGPKVVAVRRHERGLTRRSPKRGSTFGVVHVTGLQIVDPSSSNRESAAILDPSSPTTRRGAILYQSSAPTNRTRIPTVPSSTAITDLTN